MNKVLIVTDVWVPKIDGIVTSLLKTVEILEKRKFRVIIIHPGLFKTLSLFFYPELKLSFFAGRKMQEIIKTEKPDYIHIATEGPLGLSARGVCIHGNVPFTTAYHTHLPLYVKTRVHFFSGLVYVYMRWFHMPAHTTFVSTRSMEQELASHGFRHLTVAPLGVDTDMFTRNSDKTNIMLQKPVFVYFGRIAVEKNVEDFLRCTLPGTKLVIGDGPDRALLEKKYYKDSMFVGYKKGIDLVDWLSLCDVFVCPSRTETFGLVVLEALACGIPVAAYDVMGPRDIISHGVDGYICDNLAYGAQQCLELSRTACREKALHYSWNTYVDNFIAHQKPVTW